MERTGADRAQTPHLPWWPCLRGRRVVSRADSRYINIKDEFYVRVRAKGQVATSEINAS